MLLIRLVVLNFISILNHSSYFGFYRLHSWIIHFAFSGCNVDEESDSWMIKFRKPALSLWYNPAFGVAIRKGNDVMGCWKASSSLIEGRNRLILQITVTETSHIWSIGREYLFDCTHEEVDTRIVLHASLEEENVVVVAKGTDVLVLLF